MSRCKLSATIAAIVFVASIGRGVTVSAAASDPNEVCDPTADYLLGIEDYPRSIQAHLRLIAAHRDDALTHYHLGFAYGMVGRHRDELAEYLEAVGLGSNNGTYSSIWAGFTSSTANFTLRTPPSPQR